MAQVPVRSGIFPLFLLRTFPYNCDLRQKSLQTWSTQPIRTFVCATHPRLNVQTRNPADEKGTMSAVRRVLIVSLGNPEALHDTYHSAGHLALESLQKRFSSELSSFTRERYGKKAVLASTGPKYTLLQSPTLMNVSGPWLAKAYKEYLADNDLKPEELALLLVHDDLEEELGVIKIRQWSRSHRGHNGVKSVMASLKPPSPAMGSRWARVSVGIGRPEARDRSAVSDFVLSKIPRHARGILDEKASRGLYEALGELERKWEAEEVAAAVAA
ncbi:peptidyl-tRNA hydrolase [Echria macrotheca]|uniref:peptidyl-tRNA hydrolase n=1 Tax=Echria macrotheca TaxID=438768 RepID=A0AAJ0BH24_9PEZI|nr:peptidyl-tRNA hydrolase [Echria macrotheca]